MIDYHDSNKGSALIITMIVLMLIIAAGGTFLMTSTHHYKVNRHYVGQVSAEYASKGALQIATNLLNRKKNDAEKPLRIEGAVGDTRSAIYTVDGTTWKRVIDDASVNESGPSPANEIFKVKDKGLKERGNKHYRVNFSSNEPGKTLNEANAFLAKASASYDQVGYTMDGYINKNIIMEYKDVVTMVTTTMPGITGYKKIRIRGNGIVDSYKSSEGAYGPSTWKNNGSLGSNGVIDVGGAQSNPYMVYGSVSYGESLTGGSAVTGTKTLLTTEQLIPRPDKLDTQWKSSCSTPLTVGNKTPVTWDSSVATKYYYTSITTTDVITVKGNVTVYCSGDFKSSGGGDIRIQFYDANAKLTLYVGGVFDYTGSCVGNNLPSQFVINSTLDQRVSTDPGDDETKDTGYGVKLTGNTETYAIIYAPYANIKVTGNNDFFGALIGNYIYITGANPPKQDTRAKVHYDEDGAQQVTAPKTETTETSSFAYFLHSSTKGVYQD